MKEMDEKNIAIANEHMRKTIIIDRKSVSTNAPSPKIAVEVFGIFIIKLD